MITSLIENAFVSPFQSLLYITGTVLVLAFLQFHWNRRHMYKLAAQIQGPIAWPIVGTGYKFMGDTSYIYDNVMDLFKEYSRVFRVWFGPFLVYAVSAPEYLEICLNNPRSMQRMFCYKYAEPVFGLGLFTADVPVWKRHRKIIGPTFNMKLLDTFVTVFTEQTTILIEQMKKYAGKGVFDIQTVLNNCTLDIICETAMGIQGNAQTSKSEFSQWTDRAVEICFLRMFNLFYQRDFIFNRTSMRPELEDLLKRMHDFTGAVVIAKRKAFDEKQAKLLNNPETIQEEDVGKRKVFLDHLLELSIGENKLTDDEVRDEVTTFILTGSDTSASSLNFLFLLLGMHPEIQDKVYEEAMDILGPDRVVVPEDLPHFKYIERSIKEALRLFPVGAFIVRDICGGDLQLDEKVTFAEGGSVILGIMHVHRNPEYWPNPLKFDPDRFLPEEVSKRHPYSYLPFSGGPRNCIGMNYAMKVMKTITAMVIRDFRFFTEYKSVEEVKLKTNMVVRPRNGYKIYVELRK